MYRFAVRVLVVVGPILWASLNGCAGVADLPPTPPPLTAHVSGALSLADIDGPTFRLYDGVNFFFDNPDGTAFTLTLDVRDYNLRSTSPSEMLVKVYPPDGRPVVREVVPDDGLSAPAYAPPIAGWDHEAWYYETCYARGLQPMSRWSSPSTPQRLAETAKRTFRYAIPGGQKGIYRAVIVGGSDLYVTVKTDPELPFGASGNPEWLHGHSDLYKTSYVYVPRGVERIHALLMQIDRPRTRIVTLTAPDGQELIRCDASQGFNHKAVSVGNGRYDDRILRLDVSDGPGDYLLNLTLQFTGKPLRGADAVQLTLENHDSLAPWRGPQAATAVLAPNPRLAKAIQGGAVYHDGKLFWQMHQVRLYDWLKTLKPEDFDYPKDLPKRGGYVSPGSHERPSSNRPGYCDVLMYNWEEHKNRQVLNAAIRDMFYGLRLIGPGDHVLIGPLSNLAYEMGTYAFFFPRPAWRILQLSDAPEEAKGPIREFAVQVCDRLAFGRSMELVNGNSLASLVQGMRYCVEATGDPLNKELYETYLQRFISGGLGQRIGQGPSGGIQESFGYDFHYGSYVLRGWRAVLSDLKDPAIQASYDRVREMYSYVWSPLGYAPQNSRTSGTRTCGGSYNSWDPDPKFRWKGHGGGNLTASVLGANEWFAARRRNYYITTYHGRLAPTWMGEGFHGRIGLGGGAICQVHVPGAKGGTVIGSKVNGSYGSGMHLSQWRNFHIHGIVGVTTDGQPLVTANSEHFNARLEGDTVTSSGEVRESSVWCERTYTFGPSYIDCGVRLRESAADQVFGLWGGKPALRGRVAEAYEMIPFADVPRNKKTGKKGPNASTVVALGQDGSELGPLSEDKAVRAAAILIDRHGYGARVELPKPMPVLLGKNDTVLVQLASKTTPASAISLQYRIVPYLGDPPAPGAGPTVKALSVPLVPEVDELDEVVPGLAGHEGFVIKNKRTVLARVRFGFAGDNLAIHALVRDKQPTQHRTVWRGSDIEVFGAMVGTGNIGQVFLVPQVADSPAKAYKADRKPVAAPGITLQSRPTDNGYELQALIPLSLLKIDPAADTCLLEIQISSVRAVAAGKTTALYGTAFGSRLAYMDSTMYALVRLKPAPPEEDKPAEEPATETK